MTLLIRPPCYSGQIFFGPRAGPINEVLLYLCTFLFFVTFLQVYDGHYEALLTGPYIMW